MMTNSRLARRVLFRTHWLLGLTAGLVLAVVGVTGALLGFEDEILAAMNPQLDVVARGTPQAPDALIARVRAERPGRAIAGYTWNGTTHAAEVRLDGRDAGSIAIDPYDGTLLPDVRGRATFAFIEQVHRNLAAGPVGKQVVGASAIALVVLVAIGVYLRWPRRWTSPRVWLRLDFRLRGRGFLWHLHAVTGTWVLLFYLLSALTGLYFSYDFYRNAVSAFAGVTLPARGGARVPGAIPPPPIAVSLDASWHALASPGTMPTRAIAMLPRQPGAPLEWRYLENGAPHDRAFSLLRVDASDGRVIAHERYADQARGRRALSTIFPLHSGSYFGVVGRVAMTLTAAIMPLFAVTGIWLWFKRRRDARKRNAAIRSVWSPKATAREA